MSEISMIGLGAMGSALARAMLEKGRKVTVWNRTASRMAPLVAAGAAGATGVVEAVRASPLVLICIDNYASTQALLGAPEVAVHLPGRTLIQLTTGTPKEARASEAWARACGADYVDGAIMSYPSNIGTTGAMILAAGPAAAFARCQPYLACLGGDLRHVGETIGAAAALDLAILSYALGVIIGVAHGALICESEKVGVDLFAATGLDGDFGRDLAGRLHRKSYDQPDSPIAVWEGAIRRIQAQARDARTSGEFPDFMSDLFRRAIAAGYGQEATIAVIKLLRTERGT